MHSHGSGGTKEGFHDSVPDELVVLARRLWGTDVTKKAARRYIGPLLRLGDPVATVEELSRFLRSSAKSSRVQRAKFPISAACMPEEFDDWLTRARKVRLLVPADRTSDSGVECAMPLAEIAHRAQSYARTLCNGRQAALPSPTQRLDQEES
jgi:hypothetical protein